MIEKNTLSMQSYRKFLFITKYLTNYLCISFKPTLVCAMFKESICSLIISMYQKYFQFLEIFSQRFISFTHLRLPMTPV